MQQAPTTDPANALEKYALDAMILARCRRPLGHEMKNAVQGLYSGIEILSKAIETGGRFKLTPADCLPLLRRQLDGLQETLHGILDDVAPPDSGPVELDVVAVIRDLVRFLMSDAAIAGVKFDLEVPDHASVITQPAMVRKVLLGCMLDAIDAMRGGGRLRIVAVVAADQVSIECRDTRFERNLQGEAESSAPSARIDTQLLRVVARRLLGTQRADCEFEDLLEGCKVRIVLPSGPQ